MEILDIKPGFKLSNCGSFGVILFLIMSLCLLSWFMLVTVSVAS